MDDQAFVTLADSAAFREDSKGSVFLAHAQRVDQLTQVNGFLRGLLTQHAEASHLCWAYKIDKAYRFSDGGEPSGTAGQPILRAIEGQGLDHTVVGVIRYFGGTLLGAGGLMRAYGHVAAEALRQAARVEVLPRVRLAIQAPYEHTGALYRLLDAFDAEERAENYAADGLRIQVQILRHQADSFIRQLQNSTRGQATVASVK